MVLLFLVNCIGQEGNYELIALKRLNVAGSDGNSYTGEMGRIKVPENRNSSTSKFIELPFFRLKTEHTDPFPPIFIFEGGPGDNPSALQRLNEFIPLLKQFSARSDVVLIEQRGNGGAEPRLSCPETLQLPLDAPLNIEAFSAIYKAYMSECSEYWQGLGRNLRGYNVISMADDVEAVRKALSYKKIMLFGGSFGSHHALTYVKRYPENVERILLDSPEGLTHTVKLPYTADKKLAQLSELVTGDSILSVEIPSFTDLVNHILDKLEKAAITVKTRHPLTNEVVDIVLGKLDLQFVTAQVLGRRQYRELPYHYLQMKKGDYSWLASRAIGLRVSRAESLMAALTDNASATASKRREMVKLQKQDAILGDALNNVIFDVMDVLPIMDISKELNQNFKSDIPILIICGSQDVRTPVDNAWEIMEDFKNSRLVIVQHGSHDLFREALDLLLPIMKGYLAADSPLEYKVPAMVVAPLNLRVK